MKKTTLFAVAMLTATSSTQAINNGFNLLINDQFETTGGSVTAPQASTVPSNFSCTKQTFWTTSNATLNPNPLVTTPWKQIFSSNTTTNNKTYNVAAYAEEGAGVVGNTQCLKVTLTDLAFANGTGTDFTVRLQSVDPLSGLSFANTESYECKFWAKLDANDTQATRTIFKNNGTSPITLTKSWAQYQLTTFSLNTTSSTGLAIDFLRQSDHKDVVFYMDGFYIGQRPSSVIPTAATNIASTSFTANWPAVTNATSYKVYLTTSTDGGTTWTSVSTKTTPDATNSYTFTGLTPETLYRYRVTASDGVVTTGFNSNYEMATTTSIPTDVNEVAATSKVKVENAVIIVTTTAGQTIEVYNSLGQKEASVISIDGDNTISAKSKGVHIVKVGKTTTKVVL